MATPLDEGDIVKTIAYCEMRGQVSQNVRHWRVISKDVGATHTDEDVRAALATLLKAPYQDCLSQDAQWYGLSLQKIAPIKFDTVFSPNAGAGSDATDCLPGAVAGLLVFKTGLAGRKNRGRTYIPFPGEGANTALGLPNAAHLTQLQDVADIYSSNRTIVKGGLNLIITPIIYPSEVAGGRAIVSGARASKWASMRSRGDYKAANKLPA